MHSQRERLRGDSGKKRREGGCGSKGKGEKNESGTQKLRIPPNWGLALALVKGAERDAREGGERPGLKFRKKKVYNGTENITKKSEPNTRHDGRQAAQLMHFIKARKNEKLSDQTVKGKRETGSIGKNHSQGWLFGLGPRRLGKNAKKKMGIGSSGKGGKDRGRVSTR